MVIVIGNVIGNSCSNPESGCVSLRANAFGKGIVTTVLGGSPCDIVANVLE